MSFNYYFFLTLTVFFSTLSLASFIISGSDPVMLIFSTILLGGAIGFGLAARAYVK
tara:strand:+ start:3751 stop:3918 length:168 start_codon:yes stop_codon:yes gene_type:complete